MKTRFFILPFSLFFNACTNDIKQNSALELDFVPITFDEGTSLQDPLGRYELTYEFEIMTKEVTQEQFELLLGYRCQTGKDSTFLDTADAAAYFVSWHMAAHFANQWSVYNDLDTCYSCEGITDEVVCSWRSDIDIQDCSGYRLPTEAEWELSARSGSKSEFWTGQGGLSGGNYDSDNCTGDARVIDDVENPLISSFAWYCGNNQEEGPKKVGLLEPNSYGLHDMHGNVWEWTHGGGGDFPSSEQNPSNTTSEDRVLRGGAFHNNPYDMRVSFRSAYAPTKRLSGYGFRLVRSLD